MKIFSTASTVLVLDAELRDVSVRASSLEKELRLITCAWSRRVWTLHEALLASRHNLWWQFNEEALSAAEIWDNDLVLSCTDISYRNSAMETRFPILSRRGNDAMSFSRDFLDVVYSLRYRSVSRVEDETICIAALLLLSRKPLLSTSDPVERMRLFLSMWKEIPSYFVFLEGSRIEEAGCGWMPTTFIGSVHKTTLPRAEEHFTHFDANGLYVNYPGLVISASNDTALRLESGFCNPIDGIWYRVRDHGGIDNSLPAKQKWKFWRQSLHQVDRPALILEYPSNYSHNYIIAVLVNIVREKDGTLFAKHVCRVWLQPVKPEEGLETQTNPDLGSVSEVLVRATPLSQKWCVG
ncbi:hypothetical protein PV11_03664 [Exophiala sideris]|uniref:Heterokaryon incompatibility domain-containing protein n=1 Tax=Exophiala sideris TaxID=1016849 RepID=A0A0D1YKG1_9EURO|nr:hypothetical protein PV11_03664 [Exophiala sideris]